MRPNKIRLLLAEDNPDHVELAIRALTKNLPHLDVEIATSGEECLAKLAHSPFDVILLDYLLPEKDGLEVLEKMKEWGMEVPVVMITGQGNERVAVQTIKKGAYEYIIKSKGYLNALPEIVTQVLKEYNSKLKFPDLKSTYWELVENANDAIYIHDLRGYFTLLNRKAEEITGYSRSELIGEHYRKILSPYCEKKVYKKLRQKGRYQPVSSCEIEIIKKNGEKIFIDVSIVPINRKGKTIGFQGIARDISERKRAEALRDEQNERIKSMNLELLAKNQKLEETNRLQSEYVSHITHELRTPLNGILGYAELLRDGLYGSMSREQWEVLTNICECGNHLLELINQVSKIPKIQSESLKLDKELCSPEELLNSVATIIEPLAKEKNLKLAVNCAKNLPSVYLDYRKIYQVLLNLAGNAVKFTSNGKVEIGAKQKGKHIEFYVQDTGIGIAKNRLKHLFEGCKPNDGGTPHRFGGSGLGLPISKKLVELHKGEIGVKSEVNRGSTFFFKLPLNGEGVEKQGHGTGTQSRK